VPAARFSPGGFVQTAEATRLRLTSGVTDSITDASHNLRPNRMSRCAVRPLT
jgi:hypothetical protein